MPFVVPDLPASKPASMPSGEESPVILPFMSFSWSPFGGRFAQQFVQCYVDVANAPIPAARQLLAVPKGRRVLFLQNADTAANLFRHRDDTVSGRRSLWTDAGVAATKAAMTTVVEQLWAHKADIDFVVFDMETPTSCWVLSEADLAAIYADPRYAGLVATGRFPADCRNMNESQRMLFNYGCAYLNDAAIRQACIAPLYKRYNNVNWSNFGDAPCTKADAPFVPDINGHAAYYAPSSAPFFAPVLYGYTEGLGTNDARFREPFYVLALSYNTLAAVYRAKATAKMMPWMAPKVMSNRMDWVWWQELQFHACCMCGPNLLYFNADDPTPLSNWRFDNAVSQYVGQARGQVWKAPATAGLVAFDSAKFVCSAAKLVDGSMVGRVTFKPGVNTARVTVEGKSYTVNRAGDSPGAWIHS